MGAFESGVGAYGRAEDDRETAGAGANPRPKRAGPTSWGGATRRPGGAGPTSQGGGATRHDAAALAQGGLTRAVSSLGAKGASRRRRGGGAASEEETSKTSSEAVGRRPKSEQEAGPDRRFALMGAGRSPISVHVR